MNNQQSLSVDSQLQHKQELAIESECSLDLDTLEVEELEQRLELQSIGVLFEAIGVGKGTCTPKGCGWS